MDYRPYYPYPLRLLSQLVDLLLIGFGASIVTIVFVNAALRGFGGFDLAWSLELSAFLMLWVTFLGCAAAAARGIHMRVTEIIAFAAPKAAQRMIALLIDIGVIALLITLIWHGINISIHTWAQQTTVLYWPVGLLYASMPAGITLTLLFLIWNIVFQASHLKQPPDDGSRPLPPESHEGLA